MKDPEEMVALPLKRKQCRPLGDLVVAVTLYCRERGTSVTAELDALSSSYTVARERGMRAIHDNANN